MYKPPSSEKQRELVKNNIFAEEAAENSIPRIYTLTSSKLQPTHHNKISFSESQNNHPSFLLEKEDGLRFFVLGCQGNATGSQAKVAELMNALAKNQKPDFILILGDNFCDWGVDSPSHPIFKTHFYNIYTNEAKVPYIANIPCFVILGNHDENLHPAREPFQESGIPRGMHQVAHSYMGEEDTNYPTIKSKIALYTKHILDLDHLPAWNMPSRFYSLIAGSTQLFCIDSNTYVKEFLNASLGMTNINDTSKNQALWLQSEVRKASLKNRKTFLVLHHPPIIPSKRFFHSDLKLYLSEEDIKNAKSILQITDKEVSHLSYNELLRKVFKAQEITFTLTLAAHDHAIYYFNNMKTQNDYPICQITSGGGGGSLQEKLTSSEQQQMGCFLQHHGFTEIISPNHTDLIIFNIYTPAYTLKFNNQSCLALRQYPKEMDSIEKKQIQTFCDLVLAALKDYFMFHDETEIHVRKKLLNKSLTKIKAKKSLEEVKRVHKIWAYINNTKVDSLETTIKNIFDLSKEKKATGNETSHSFLTILNKKLVEHYHDKLVTIENVYQKILENQREVSI